MHEFLNRPYRSHKVREQRKHAVVEYHRTLSKIAAKRKGEQAAKQLLVPPELINIVEESIAGIPTDSAEGTDAGTTFEE